MPTKIAIMLDGDLFDAKSAGKHYDPDCIEKIGLACSVTGEKIHRIVYYDRAPFSRSAILPVSGNKKVFAGGDARLKAPSYKDLFCIRLGVLKFRGYVINNDKITYTPGQPLTDAGFHPEFEQKGVGMRLGIDMQFVSKPLSRFDRSRDQRHRLHSSHEVRPESRSSDRPHYRSGLPARSGTGGAFRFPAQHRLARLKKGKAPLGNYETGSHDNDGNDGVLGVIGAGHSPRPRCD